MQSVKKALRGRSAFVLIILTGMACNLSGDVKPTSNSVITPAITLTPGAQPSPDTPDPVSVWQPEHLIGVRVVDGIGEFYDTRTQEAFVPRGVNYVFIPVSDERTSNLTLKVGIYDPARTRADFAYLAELGYNTVRVFLDQCSSGPDCIGDSDGAGLNPAYLDNIADMTFAAQEAGIFLLLTSNDLPDDGGYSQEANRREGDTFAGYRNSFYLRPEAITATRRYWRDILTGLIERQAALDAVLGWQLLNEQWMFEDQPPLSLTEGLVETTTGTYDMSDPAQKERMVSEGLIHYIAQMREEILIHDPTALVTMGFFAPGVAPGWYVDTVPLLAKAELDFFDFHGYPGSHSMADLAARFGMAGYTEKPILLGEYGAFRHLYDSIASGARAVTDWAAASCLHGFDGWLYWSFYPANAEVGDRTWAFTDEEAYLMKLFAPINTSNPCEAVEVPSSNLAFDKPITASRSLAGEPPEYAVDENAGTQCGAGNHPPQWIQIELEGVFTITEIRLLAAQYPEGATLHRVWARSEGSANFVQVHEFSGITRDGDWLVFNPSPALEAINAIRIETVNSPSWVSWREIQVFGD